MTPEEFVDCTTFADAAYKHSLLGKRLTLCGTGTVQYVADRKKLNNGKEEGSQSIITTL